jgi:hypothetical protein
MDEQNKIKFLKSFDHGLQNLFIKTKKRDLSKNIWFIEGLRPPFGPPLSKPFSPLLQKKKI